MLLNNLLRSNYIKFLLKKQISLFKQRNVRTLLSNRKDAEIISKFSSGANACCDDSGEGSGYHPEVECLVNNQIIAEYNASFAYLSMSCYFGRTDVALPGSQGFFLNMHEEEHQHVLQFVKYHIMRGGQVILCPLHCPKNQDWKCITHALACSLKMEKLVKKKLMEIVEIGQQCKDDGVVDWITSNFIQEQDRSICEFGRLLTRANAIANDPIGEFLFDQMLHRSFVKKAPANSSNEIINLKTYK